MAYCDFVVKYDPKTTTAEELTKRILYTLVIKRLKHKKPAVIFIAGKSGEGKSHSAIKLEQLLLELQGLTIKEYINNINVYTPIEYPEKLNKLLYDKALKKVNIICMHEAREIIKAQKWHSFLNQAIADVNAMSRAIKRLCIIVVSQSIKDISKSIRYTLNYYCKVVRPMGQRARLYINVMWIDERDLDNPKLKKRKLSGYLVLPSGIYRRYVPQYLELSPLSKDIAKEFDMQDMNAKSGIIKNKINKLLKEMKDDIGEESNKINAMVDWYSSNSENIHLIGRRYKNKLRVSLEFKEMHELTDNEVKQFELQINEALKEQGVIENG